MASGERTKFDNPVVEWIDSRLPVFTLMQKEYGVFPTPRNFNYLWNFGAIASVMLILMILTGIFLAMNYAANTEIAFDSVEHIMRDVNYGWLIRYMHSNGASFFFIAVYIHIYRGMYYGSFKKPRELLWILGVVIFILMMATAFMGYVLPWGQMSYWGATVITNLFSAIPLVGESIKTLLWGGFSVDNPTLNRFFALHYLLPFVIFAVVFLHVWALHVTGSNNPVGIEPKSEKDTLPFHPYYTIKDSVGLLVFLAIFCVFVFFMPDILGHPDNYKPADPLVTPPHIVPEWYFLPFYAMLRAVTFDLNLYLCGGGLIAAYLVYESIYSTSKTRLLQISPKILTVLAGILLACGAALAFLKGVDNAVIATIVGGLNFDWLPDGGFKGNIQGLISFIPAKLGGVMAMFGSLLMLILMPWLDTHPIRSARFRPLYKAAFLFFVFGFFVLTYIGSQPADASLGPLPLSLFGLLFTGYYYLFFLIVLPWLSRNEKGRDLPKSIHEAVLAKKKGA